MSDRTVMGIRACIASLEKIIGPVVAQSEDSLAKEQLTLMTRYLDQVTQRLDYARDYTRVELQQYVKMARDIVSASVQYNIACNTLTEVLSAAESGLANPKIRTRELEDASIGLRAIISQITRGIRYATPEFRARIESIVLNQSAVLVDLKRAWCKPQGWESNSPDVPDLEALIARHSA